MATGYSQSPKLLKGAIIQFSAPMLVPIPNIIVFQYNPETMTRQLNPWKPREKVVYGSEEEAKKAGEKLLGQTARRLESRRAARLRRAALVGLRGRGAARPPTTSLST